MKNNKYKYVPVYTSYGENSLNGPVKTIEELSLRDAANIIAKRTILDFYRDTISDADGDEGEIETGRSYIEGFVGDVCIHGEDHASIGHGEEEIVLVLAPTSPFYNIIEIDQEEWVDAVNDEWIKLFESFDNDYCFSIVDLSDQRTDTKSMKNNSMQRLRAADIDHMNEDNKSMHIFYTLEEIEHLVKELHKKMDFQDQNLGIKIVGLENVIATLETMVQRCELASAFKETEQNNNLALSC